MKLDLIFSKRRKKENLVLQLACDAVGPMYQIQRIILFINHNSGVATLDAPLREIIGFQVAVLSRFLIYSCVALETVCFLLFIFDFIFVAILFALSSVRMHFQLSIPYFCYKIFGMMMLPLYFA